MTWTAGTPTRPSSSRSTAFSTRSTSRQKNAGKLRDVFAPYVARRLQGRPRRRGRRRPGRARARRRHRRSGAEQGHPGLGQEGRQGHLRPGPHPAGDRRRVPRQGGPDRRSAQRATSTPGRSAPLPGRRRRFRRRRVCPAGRLAARRRRAGSVSGPGAVSQPVEKLSTACGRPTAGRLRAARSPRTGRSTAVGFRSARSGGGTGTPPERGTVGKNDAEPGPIRGHTTSAESVRGDRVRRHGRPSWTSAHRPRQDA